jgi:hypothetical protein
LVCAAVKPLTPFGPVSLACDAVKPLTSFVLYALPACAGHPKL